MFECQSLVSHIGDLSLCYGMDVLLEKLPNGNSPKNTKFIEIHFHACSLLYVQNYSIQSDIKYESHKHTRTHPYTKYAHQIFWYYKTLFHLKNRRKKCEKISTLRVFSRIAFKFYSSVYCLITASHKKNSIPRASRKRPVYYTLKIY